MLASGQAASGDAKDLNALPFEQLLDLRVQTATLRKQSLQDAPASVTVVTAEDIRRYGYRTLAEVLSNVRGFYISSDGPYHYAGARGFSLLGDYNTRFLVLINGHHLTDNVYSAMYYLDRDFPLDLDLVQQIEIVRGPTSALYGSNGLFATINIITRTPTSADRGRVSVETGSFGEAKVTMSSSFAPGGGARALVSGSVLHSGGRTVDFPELAEAGMPSRTKVGKEAGYHFFADLVWKNWTVTALFGQHKAIVPTGWYKSVFGDTGTSDLESRNFVEAAWNRPVGQNGALRWRTYYDQYRYDGVYVYETGTRNYDGALGDWIGSQLVYHHDTRGFGALTLGGEFNVDLRNVQYNFDIRESEDGFQRNDVFRRSQPRTGYAVFAQQEFRLSPGWTAYLGGRLDDTTADKMFFSPRAALVHKRASSAYKLMYGRAFRNPSTYERYWEPNPELVAERIHTFEFTREQTLRQRANLITTVYHYRLGDLVVGVPVREDTLQYRNASRATATGFEMELNGQPASWLEAVASFSLQRTRGIDSEQRLENSPARLARFRASVPLARRRLMLGGAVRYLGSRFGVEGAYVPAAVLADLTLTTSNLHPRLEFQFGIRNLMDRKYSDPLSAEHATRLIPGAGRFMYVRLTWRHE